MSNTLPALLFVGSGVALTLELLIGGIAVGVLLGTSLAILRYMYKGICGNCIGRIVSVIRGTPLILQLSIVYFITPVLLDCKLSILATGIIAFGINSSAYVSEILRAGVESLPKGQFEAAKTLEITSCYMWKDIILPQVFVNIFPAFINEIVSLLKETALISVIGGMDIMRKSQIIAAEHYEYFTPLCLAGAYYYGLVILIEYIGQKIEKRKFYAKNS
ncbi:MAG: amino acid ABC transporter permease [Holosporales bacterium]|jgi:polar amino acid transport system permease protein|nr:amino acid ABC transporter permease [Holosporales bacterium]